MSDDTAEILRMYGPFPGVEHVHGVSFDGARVWIAVGNRLSTVDPESGTTSGSLDVLAEAGTAFDGKYLYQIAEGVIRKLDPVTGKLLNTIPAPDHDGNSGLAWAEGSLWVGHYGGRRIHQIDPATGRILSTIESDRFVTGVTWVDGELWHGTWEDQRSDLRHVDAATGKVLKRLDMPQGVGVSGLESDGHDRFFCGGGGDARLRAVKRP